MKKLFLFIALFSITNAIYSQQNGELKEYRRNALATMMVYHSEDTFGMHIHDAFQTIPTPEKYDDHNFGWNVILNDSIKGAKKRANGLIKAQMGKILSPKDIKTNGKVLEQLLNDAQCAKIMVAKWFGMDVTDSTCNIWDGFHTKLIQERGQYDASDIDVANALLTTKGVAALSDAGEELINNTFVLVNDMTYVTAEEKAAVAKVVMAVLGGLIDGLTGSDTGTQLAQSGSAIADSFTGFTVKTHSYLFQLVWNDSIANTFYNQYYIEYPKTYEDSAKIVAFFQDETLFRLKYVAHEYEYDGKSALKGQYTREELVKTSCTQSMDKNIAALQLAYEDFKVKTPVYEIITNNKGKITGYTAKIGLKEGITEKSSFQVVRCQNDTITNRTTYRYVATLKPIKGKIWDNRYNAVKEKTPGSNLTATQFKKVSGGEILPGMLIIEGKYKKVQTENSSQKTSSNTK